MDPTEQLSPDERVLLNPLRIQLSYVSLKERQHLVSFKGAFALACRCIAAHSLKELIANEGASLFYAKQIGIALANVLPFIAKQVEECLQDAWELKNVQVSQF